MNQWKNLNEMNAYQKLLHSGKTDLTKAMSGEEGKKRVAEYKVPMAAGLIYNFAAKQVNDEVLGILCELAQESQLATKFEELYNGAVINTGENRRVLHHLTRGQLGMKVIADEKDKRVFYVEQQKKIAEFESLFPYFGRQ